MSALVTIPDLRLLAQPFLGRPYAEDACWQLVIELMQAGGFLMHTSEPGEAVKHVSEVWWEDDPRDPLTLVQPWDWYLLRKGGPAVSHIGLVVDQQSFVHVRTRVGVCIEPLRRWRAYLMQVARLHCLS